MGLNQATIRTDVKFVTTTCKSCHGGCGVIATVEKGKLTKIEGNPESPTWGTMCAKGLSGIQEVYNPDRIMHPMKRKGKRGGGKWERISWEQALDIVAVRMKESIEKHGTRSVAVLQGTGRGYNRYTFRFARSLGIPNIGLPADFCYGPRLAAFGMTVGGRLYCDYHGWGGEFPKTQISWGKQLEITNADGEMAVWFLNSLEEAEHLILIDPRATRLAGRADLWLKVRPGTDAALALGMLHVIINEGLYDTDFVKNWTYGFDRLRERVRQYPPDKVAEITWIPKGKIIEAARIFGKQRPGCIQIGESLEAGNNSTQTLRAIVCLMAVTGNIERPGSMINWVTPDTGPMEDFAMEVPAPEELAIGAEEFRLLASPPFAMCHVHTLFKQLREGTSPIRLMHLEGTNPLVTYPNSREVKEGLLKVDFLSVADLYMSPSAEYADVILPAAHWLETDDILDMHPRFMIGCIQKVVDPVGEAWPDNKIFNELGKRIAPKWWFDSVEEMLDYQLRKADITWKGFTKMGFLGKMGKDQPYYKYKTDYWRDGGGFLTNTGKVELYSTVMAELGYDPLPYYREPNESPYSTPELAKEYPLILSTGGRLPYYFHSQYRQVPYLRERQPYPLVQIHPETADKLGIKDGDWVWIETPRGKIRQVAKLFEGMDPRVVMTQASWWYPEETGPDHCVWRSNTNVLTSNDPPYDPSMGSTTFRALLCRVSKVEDE
ncbi:MAG: molybdopterin-dependent oxidoreductase [Proteobacteria bacterium]|nr:molybdopterin-dependent oxidoreductase [Pseudomonadota bacterium]NIS72297.1 molybdopterin-dependent oxidoreductase [Pseudomonadota bacterium]